MTFLLTKITFIAYLIWALPSLAINNGEKAIAFSLFSHTNEQINLENFKGKTIVLEWFNKGCPFVKKFYESKSMQKWQGELTQQGIIWLTISSSAHGKQGFETVTEVSETRKNWKISSTYNLLDHDGKVGKLYEAKTTPHIYVIDKNFNLVYQGAIDSILSTDQEDIPKAENYLLKAIEDLANNRSVKIAKTKPYGCSVKY